jgi:general secretion pathway protein D
MKPTTLAATLAGAILSLLLPSAYAQSSEAAVSEHVEGAVPIVKVIAAVARKSGKKFIIDPRVRAEVVLVGQDATALGLNDLLAVLKDYGFAAVEYAGYVHVVPDSSARVLPIPQISGKEVRPDAEVVSKVITVKNVSAAQLVPILRPLLSQAASLAAFPCNNRLIAVDIYANVRRVEALVESLDVGEPYKPPQNCGVQEGGK